MNQVDQTVTTTTENTGFKFSRVWPWLAGGALAALGVANGFLFDRVNTLQAEVAQVRAASDTEINALREATAAAAMATQQNLAQISTSVEAGTRSASVAAPARGAGCPA